MHGWGPHTQLEQPWIQDEAIMFNMMMIPLDGRNVALTPLNPPHLVRTWNELGKGRKDRRCRSGLGIFFLFVQGRGSTRLGRSQQDSHFLSSGSSSSLARSLTLVSSFVRSSHIRFAMACAAAAALGAARSAVLPWKNAWLKMQN